MAEVRINFTVDDKGAVTKIRAVGDAVEQVGKKGQGATSNMDSLGAKMAKLTPTAASLASALAVVGTAAVAAFTALGAAAAGAVASIVNFAGPLSDLALKTGLSTQFLQEWAVAAGQVGVSMESIANSSLKLSEKLGAVGGVSKATAEALNAIGLSAKELEGLNQEEQWDAVTKALSKVKDENLLVAAGTALMGKQFKEVLPIIRSDFEAVKEEAKALGIILDEGLVKAAEHTGDRFDILGQAVNASAMQLGGAIVQSEEFQRALEQIITAVGLFNQFIIENRAQITAWVDGVIKPAAGIIGDLIVALGGWALALMRINELNLQAEILMTRLGQGVRPIQEIQKELAAAQAFGDKFHASLTKIDQTLSPSKLLASVQAFGAGLKTADTDVDTFSTGVGEAGKVMDETEKKAKQLAETLGFGGVQKEANAATLAIQSLGGASMLSATGIQSLSGLIEQMRKNSMELTPELRAVALELDKIALNKGMFEVAKSMEPLPIITEEWTTATQEQTEAFAELGDLSGEILPKIETDVGGIEKKTISFGDAMDGVNDILSEARGFMDLFGIAADTAFGKVIGWASKAFDMFNSLTGMISKIGGLLGGIGGGGGGGILGGIGSLFGLGGGGGAAAAGTAATGATVAGGAAGGVGGALGGIGGAISGGVSSIMGGISTALAAIPVAGWIALAGVGVGFLIKALFGGRDAETVAEEAGRDLGVEVSEGLAKQIHKSGKNVQLFLKEIFAEGNLSVGRLAEEQADIFSGIEQGLFSVEEGMAALGASVPDVLANFEELGHSGEAQIERLLRAADETGQSFDGMGEVAAALGQSLVDAATVGGDAWLNAQNEIGTSGRESLEFLRNEYGTVLPEAVLAAIDSILGLNSAVAETAAGANAVNENFAQLPATAETAVAGISTAFNEGSAAITEGLVPISDTIANEIRAAGETTSEAIGSSFATTNTAIEMGLNQIGLTFTQGVAPAANAAAAATMNIAEAAEAAARAAASIDFPSAPDYSGIGFADIPTTGAQHGFEGRVKGPRMFFVEPGIVEDVRISRPGEGKSAGGGSVSFSPVFNISLQAGTPYEFARQIRDAIERNVDGLEALIRQRVART